jgi:hypothetical protein
MRLPLQKLYFPFLPRNCAVSGPMEKDAGGSPPMRCTALPASLAYFRRDCTARPGTIKGPLFPGDLTLRERLTLGRGRRTEKTGFHPRSLGRCRGIQRGPQGRQLLLREHAQKRLQHDLGFAQAGIEVVVDVVEPLPGIARMHAQALRDVAGRLVELALKVFERLREDTELVEEARAGAEKHMVKNSVP